ncbi:unnamed protein product [Rotaria magnacalcarata]|uniref:Uncharacterized protein n=2 Tax=Rotaria magnacalcarata TaxID=392030 RepID=A0A816KA87_9BILA|nr:unnamed protein product [Rotaria magnacalcarata]CAF1241909.1 unnamed protein product [Rotaria magnacalcarata]CAF1922033.1 unnamed protein product [Rotaria magnacalcarata]CAF3859186.1 unnamed protein product [Rotaria magnacalcarata]CAF4201974.1 unnamed protein product [Rotaria magnacalcarata]
MGGFFSRSSHRGTKSKRKKGKHTELEQTKGSPELDRYNTQNNTEQNTTDMNIANGYEDWNKQIDHQQITNYNDPSGVPTGYANNYPMVQNDIMNQSLLSHHDVNNQYYSMNPLAMSSSNIPYDPIQYIPNQMHNSSINQAQQMLPDERSSRKVQFARTVQQGTPSKAPLSSTQSWHEPSATTNDLSVSISHQDSTLTRQTIHRSVQSTANTSSAQAAVEKPIYVGIDHRATLAERGQRNASKRQHTNGDKNNIDVSNSSTSNHRTRSRTHRQHKHQDSNDSSTSKVNHQSNKMSDPSQTRLSNTHRSGTTTMSSAAPNRSVHHSEPPIINENDTKLTKRQQYREAHVQPAEHQLLVDNEIKSSRQRRGGHSQLQKQPLNQLVNRNNSPVRADTTRRTENKQEPMPVARISLSPQPQQRLSQRQKHHTLLPPIATTSISVNRTRV